MGLGDFFRDYGGVVASALPAVAAYIAMLIAQYYKERPTAKGLLMIAAGLLVVASIVVNAEYQHQIAAEIAHRVAIRKELGKFIEEGIILKGICANAVIPLPTDAVADWDNRAAVFLNTNLDSSFVARFRDPTGATPPIIGGPVERRELWLEAHIRVFRLEEFSRQLPL